MTDTSPKPKTVPEPPLKATRKHQKVVQEPEGQPVWRIFWAIIAGTAIIAGAILVVGLDGNDDNSGSNSQATATVTATQSTIQASPDECGPDGYPLAFQPEGALPDLQVLPDKPGSTHAVDSDADVRKAFHENPRFLALWANRLSESLWANGNDWKPLATDNMKCMSDKGKEILGKVETILEFQLDHVDENGEVSSGMTNMGLTADGAVSNAHPGIEGDRSAVVYHFKDGTVIPVMKRCANLPTEGPTHPTVTTFTTPPSTTKTTPSTTTTTPSTTTSTTTTETTTTQTTTETTTTPSLPPKTNTPHPSNPGYTPMPTMGPSHTAPTAPPTNPAPPPASLPTDAPIIPVTTRTSTATALPTVAPPTSTPGTTVSDPGALPS